jgi:enolase
MTRQGVVLTSVSALEILDSRGNPTVQVTLVSDDGRSWVAGVPSGASTGTREAVELRDGDAARYGGKGVTRAVANVNGELADLLLGRRWDSLADLDRATIELDGTPTKARLGANALVGVSMAAVAAAGRRDATAARAALQRAQWGRARAERPGLPGVHDRAGRCAVVP